MKGTLTIYLRLNQSTNLEACNGDFDHGKKTRNYGEKISRFISWEWTSRHIFVKGGNQGPSQESAIPERRQEIKSTMHKPAAKERGRQAQCSEVKLSLVAVPCTVVGCSIFDYSALPHIALFWVTLHCLKLQCIAFDWIAKCVKLHCIEVRFVWQLTLVSHLNKIALNMNDTKLLWVKLHCNAVRIFWRLTLVSVVQVVGHPHCPSFIRMKSLHLIALHLN